MTMTKSPRSGFTLNEVLIALTILGIIGAAATKLLASQSRFYDQQTNIRNARSIARSSVNVMLSDLRMVQDSGGVDSVSDDGRTMRVLVPYRFGLVCGTTGTTTTVMMLPIDSAVAGMSVYNGFAFRNPNTGRYTYIAPANPTAADKPVSAAVPALCTGNGGGQARLVSVAMNARTSATLDLPYSVASGAVATSPVFFYQKITYSFKTSGTYPNYYGLYRNVQGGVNEELLAPFQTDARFRYYVRGSDTSRVTVPVKDSIRGVDLVLNAVSPRAVSNGLNASPSSMVMSIFFKNIRAF
jgi:prepilin-type N-terminal cleavage/methylation domain-containing protein